MRLHILACSCVHLRNSLHASTQAATQISLCPFAMVAEHILHDVQPFPGDDHFPQLQTESWEVNNRFSVTQRSKDSKTYLISDTLTNFQAKISKKSLPDESFDLGRWYTQKRLHHFDWETSDDAPIRKMTESGLL